MVSIVLINIIGKPIRRCTFYAPEGQASSENFMPGSTQKGRDVLLVCEKVIEPSLVFAWDYKDTIQLLIEMGNVSKSQKPVHIQTYASILSPMHIPMPADIRYCQVSMVPGDIGDRIPPSFLTVGETDRA